VAYTSQISIDCHQGDSEWGNCTFVTSRTELCSATLADLVNIESRHPLNNNWAPTSFGLGVNVGTFHGSLVTKVL